MILATLQIDDGSKTFRDHQQQRPISSNRPELIDSDLSGLSVPSPTMIIHPGKLIKHEVFREFLLFRVRVKVRMTCPSTARYRLKIWRKHGPRVKCSIRKGLSI